MTKLKREEVEKIKTELSQGRYTQEEIGSRYGVSRSVISDIKCGRGS
jgi:transcriptional regulator with XRE-family HTH domain